MLGADWTAYEKQVREALGSGIELLDRINDGLLSNAGKQLRPMMSLLMARSCAGSCTQDSVRYAAASELLHNATLIHDDIADESSVRRGKPTLSALLGPSTAVLVGDYWLSKSVKQIVDTGHQLSVTPIFARTLSYLAEGEMLQLQKAEAADTSEEDYLRIVYCKTASLFESCCEAAAVSVDAPQNYVEAAKRYGAATGIAFQIKDDIFDYLDGESIGKPVGIDLKERKITLPLLGAMKGAADEAALRAMVSTIPEHPENCDKLRSIVLERGGTEYAAARLDDFVREALSALEVLPDSPEKEILAQLARYNAIRKK